jgi:hypothetical protein
MSKKLEANGLWESSRMIIPQHKESALRQAAEVHAIPRPILDDQEVDIINATLRQSYIFKKNVDLSLYGEYEQRSMRGIVTRIQRDSVRLDTINSLDGSEDREWILFADVIKAELQDSGE